MFNEEVRRMLLQVITSWQVLVVTGVLVLYVFLVNYVARIYHRRPRRTPMPKPVMPEAPSPSESDELQIEDQNE